MSENPDFPRELRHNAKLLKPTYPYTGDMLERAAGEIERLLKRQKVLEMVIYQEILPELCDCIANREIVEGIHDR